LSTNEGNVMRSKLLSLGLAGLTFGLAACGSGGSGSGAATGGSRGAGASVPGPVHIYRLTLSGAAETPHGAPNGSGDAILAFHAGSLICWRFAHLHGFTDATFAHIHVGARGRSGQVVVPLSTGPRLHHQGCVRVGAGVVNAIEQHPQEYYVNIHSAQYPGGAVRAQL